MPLIRYGGPLLWRTLAMAGHFSLWRPFAMADLRYGGPLSLAELSRKVIRIGTVRYNWPMSAHALQAFSIAHCTDSEDLPLSLISQSIHILYYRSLAHYKPIVNHIDVKL